MPRDTLQGQCWGLLVQGQDDEPEMLVQGLGDELEIDSEAWEGKAKITKEVTNTFSLWSR